MGVRDSAAQIVNAFGRGYEAVMSPYDQSGPEGRPAPFAPGTVTPGAIAAKSLSSLIYGHRAAANARLERDRVAKGDEYRDLQMQVLQKRLAEPAAAEEPTITKTLPDGTPWTGTAKEYATHYGTFNPKPASTATSKRLHMAQGEAQRLGIPWDPATGTVDDGEARSSSVVRSAKTLEDLRGNNNRRAESRLDISTTAQQLAGAQKSLDDIAKSEERYADAGADRSRQSFEAAGRVLLSATASPTLRARAARMLGVRAAMATDPTGQKATGITDANGAPVYDAGDIKAAVEAKTKAARLWHLKRIRAQNDSTRASFEGVRRFTANAIAEDGAPAAGGSGDWLGAIRAKLDSLDAPADTTDIIDQPALD